MYVCVCHGIRCRDIRAAKGEGACRPGQIFRQLDIKPQCGRCMATIRDLLDGDEGPCKAPVVSRRGHPAPRAMGEG